MVFKYPQARRDETAIDEYHGVKIQDPYRWLEDPDSKETKEFIRLQNELSVPYLESCGVREKLNKRIKDLWNFPKYGCPFKEGKYYYYFMNSGLQNQCLLYQQEGLECEAKVFLDPNKLSKDGLVSLSIFAFSQDGEYFAYGLSESGSDWIKIKVKNVSTKEDFPEVLKNIKFSQISWTHDNKGFFYSRYPKAEGSVDGHETTVQENHSIFYHRIGTDQSADILCAQFPEHPNCLVGASVSNCGKYLLIGVDETFRHNNVCYCDLTKLPNGISGLLPLKYAVDSFDAEYKYIDNEGSLFTFLTDKNAPLRRVVAIDFENPEEANWKVLIPEDSKNVLNWALCINNDKLLAGYVEDVKSLLSLYELKTGKKLHTFSLDAGNVTGQSGKKKLSEVFFRFESFLTPLTIYHFDLKTGYELKEFRRISIPDFDPSQFETKQVFYPSKDGTKIPMFIIHPKNFVKDGTAPALQYGYGGFNHSLLPEFSVSRIVFMMHFGGVVAIPNIRGGGEYGDRWYSEGKVMNKQNSYDDFHAAAEYLIANKYTCSKKLTINGISNGGLLVGASITQRPELYGCAVAQVGVYDMLKFHKFTFAAACICDFGSSDDKEQFHYLLKYSPLHNVRVPKDDTQYPAVLLLTADHDDRVVPLHSFKFTAEMQYRIGNCQKQENPLLLKIDFDSGHFDGKPTSKLIEEVTDIYCFMCKALCLKYLD